MPQSNVLSTAMRQRLFLPNSFFKGQLPLPTFVLYVLSGAGPSYLISTSSRKRRFRECRSIPKSVSSSNNLEQNANPDICVGFRAKCIRAAKKLDCRMKFTAFLVCLWLNNLRFQTIIRSQVSAFLNSIIDLISSESSYTMTLTIL